jgi:hypothetical protein
MELSKLHESTEEVYEKLLKINKWPTVYDGDTRVSLSYSFDHPTEDSAVLDVMVSYSPKQPIIGKDIFRLVMDLVLQNLKNLVPGVELENFGTKVMIKLSTFSVYYKEGVLPIFSYMDRPIVNEITLPRELSQLFQDGTDEYRLATDNQVPTFGEGYDTEMDRLIKKTKNIFRAFRKGTYKGLPYYFKSEGTVTVHQERDRYNFEDKILYPDLSSTISTGHVTYEGEDLQGLYDQLKKKFGSYGIRYS